jgi:hypothetical protein
MRHRYSRRMLAVKTVLRDRWASKIMRRICAPLSGKESGNECCVVTIVCAGLAEARPIAFITENIHGRSSKGAMTINWSPFAKDAMTAFTIVTLESTGPKRIQNVY